ncbi:MAG: hypothetical protein QG639_1106 [Patescibacteria group bacterium]|nr:hypothetical protein [Patescibacteria group bacterium]
MNELGTVLNEVSLPLAEWSLLSSKINKFIPHILAVWPLAVISYGLIKVRKYSALVLSLVICFLLSLILSSFVPGFFWVNEVYFRFFGMFRSVGRLSHFTNLFLSLTVAVLLMEKTSTADKKVIVGIICAGLLAVAISITNHPTLRETTNFSVIASLYDEISAATPIQAIATYPLSLSDGSQGFPSTYQLISQIVHKKPFSSGVSQLDHGEARIYQDEIRYSVNPEAISTLQEHGIDTIFVYNNLVDNQQIVNELLQADSRLTFIGRFSREPDVVSRSANDLSRDISVYSFVDPVPNPFSSSNVNSTEKIESYMYKATINDVNQPLLLPLPYSSRWMAYSSPASTNIFHFLFAKDAIPSVKDGFSNSWKASQLCTNVPCEVVLLFEPYAMKITLRWLSWFTIVISVYITAVGLLKERYP